MEQQEKKFNIEEFKNSELLKVLNLATIVSITMIVFYSLGAYLNWKQIKKLK